MAIIYQVQPKEVTRVISQVGLTASLNDDGTTTIKYSLNDEGGNSIKEGIKIVDSKRLSFLSDETVDFSNFDIIFAEDDVVYLKQANYEI